MTTIKLEISEDNPNVLYHFGEALRNLALDLDYVGKDNHLKTTISKTVGDINQTVTNSVNEPVVSNEERAELVKQFENASNTPEDYVEPLEPEVIVEPDNDNHMINDTDIVKLPWDKRIHSRGKTELADGTLRYTRKPSDKTKEEWELYIEEVEAELTALMLIPVATGEAIDVLAVTPDIVTPDIVTPDIVTPDIVTPDIVTPDIVTPDIVTPDIVTPDIVTPDIVTPDIVTPPKELGSLMTFGQLMKFITTNGKKLNNDIVKGVLAENNIASIALLAARNELIPQVYKALLGKL